MKKAEEILATVNVENRAYLSDLEFRIAICNLLEKPKNGFFSGIDWCTNEMANKMIVEGLIKRIKAHPIIWKLFFMI